MHLLGSIKKIDCFLWVYFNLINLYSDKALDLKIAVQLLPKKIIKMAEKNKQQEV